MIHVEKTMIHASYGYLGIFFDIFIYELIQIQEKRNPLDTTKHKTEELRHSASPQRFWRNSMTKVAIMSLRIPIPIFSQ